MKLNLTVTVITGIEQQVKVEEGVRKVRAVYESKHHHAIGYIRKGVENRLLANARRCWVAYAKDGRQIGVYTRRDYALEAVVWSCLGGA